MGRKRLHKLAFVGDYDGSKYTLIGVCWNQLKRTTGGGGGSVAEFVCIGSEKPRWGVVTYKCLTCKLISYNC